MTPQEKKARIGELTALLSEAARVYEQEDREIMSNFEYDRLYDELLQLENETGIVLAGSPTHKVGYEVVSELPKERHESPMLSLNKTKSREELAAWLGDHSGVLSWKMDGLTVVLTYDNGELSKAVTRGNGEVGEIITANARTFKNLPLKISYRGRLVLRGEAVIRYSDFERINAAIPETDAKYKNPRNLCSGSVRQLDSSITAKRSVYLYAFALISANDDAASFAAGHGQTGVDAASFATRHEQLDFLASLGFDVVERELVDSANVGTAIEHFSDKISSNDFPSDGLVLVYDNIAYGNSLGRTSKFPRDGIAFKWADEQAETALREVEWSASRTGLINPVAIFDPVELEGTTVSRASLHNISIMEELKLGLNDRITVYKANMIIPQIADNLTKSGVFRIIEGDLPITTEGSSDGSCCGSPIPIEGSGRSYCNPLVASVCPVCHTHTAVREENGVRVLICPNPSCAAKKIKLFALMASRDALNIDGMSEATVEKLIDEGLMHDLADIFKLKEHFGEIASMDGFGKKSCENLLAAIEKARNTTLDRIVYSLGIPNIGLANAKLICRYASYNPERIPKLTSDELSGIDKIGDILAGAFTDYFADPVNLGIYNDLIAEVNLEAPETVSASSAINGKTFVITGSVAHFANRNEAKDFIEKHGGKVTGSVTKNTDYLVNNDVTSTSSKNKTAKELGIPIISEEELLKLAES
ncbi:MAG: NAD-dependent DNA ligase LigA [Lachnospiraceae bacterium]|nr:NAD-dependent DNA ligase LigA [Lachnospiraceae bacterium]